MTEQEQGRRVWTGLADDRIAIVAPADFAERTEVARVSSTWGDFVVAFDHIEECFVAIAEDGAPGTPAGDANAERKFDTLLGAMIAIGQAVERDFAEEFDADETTLGEAMVDVAAEATR